MEKVRVVFVCMGNICRSPTAEAVFLAQLHKAGLSERVHVSSAGTHAYHIGSAPDSRAQAAARARGYDLSGLRGAQASEADLSADYLLVMDEQNMRDLKARFPEARAQKLMSYAPQEVRARFGDDVPDPYFGGDAGFSRVLDMLEAASSGLLADLKTRYAL